jgi:hypothetical protein
MQVAHMQKKLKSPTTLRDMFRNYAPVIPGKKDIDRALRAAGLLEQPFEAKRLPVPSKKILRAMKR